MEQKQLAEIMDNSTVTELKDENGRKVPAIAFVTQAQARKTHKFLRDIYLFWREFPNFNFKDLN